MPPRKRKIPVIAISSDESSDEKEKRPAKRSRGQAKLDAQRNGRQLQFQLALSSSISGEQVQEERRKGLLLLPLKEKAGGVSASKETPAQIFPSTGDQRLWSGKHAPPTLEDLVVHKKKVADVRTWLGLQMRLGTAACQTRVLLLSGPAGCGKTSVVELLAQDLGFELCEWRPPVMMSWDEYRYQRTALGEQYASKLDDFESYTMRAKLAPLPLCRLEPAAEGGASQGTLSQPSKPSNSKHEAAQARPKLLLVEDLPHAAGLEHRRRLGLALTDLAASARCPVVIIATTGDEGHSAATTASSSGPDGLHKDIVEALEVAGCAHIVFNPITARNAAKALQRAAGAEGLALPPTQALALAERTGGDLHHALGTLQLAARGQPVSATRLAVPAGKAHGRARAKAAKAVQPEPDAPALVPAALGRDVGLNLFHALGKILHNKRLDAEPPAAGALELLGVESCAADDAPGGASIQPGCGGPALGQDREAATSGHSSPVLDGNSPCAMRFLLRGHALWQNVRLAARYVRPVQAFDPEGVLVRSGIAAGPAAVWLHENFLHYVPDDELAAAAEGLAFFSDTDRILSSMLAGPLGGEWELDMYPAASFADAAAGSVLLRGLLFANPRPMRSQWRALRGAVWHAAQRGARRNLQGIKALVSREGFSARDFAVDILPFLRVMACSPSGGEAAAMLPSSWAELSNGQLHEQAGRHGTGEGAGPLHAPNLPSHGEGNEQDTEVVDDIEE